MIEKCNIIDSIDGCLLQKHGKSIFVEISLFITLALSLSPFFAVPWARLSVLAFTGYAESHCRVSSMRKSRRCRGSLSNKQQQRQQQQQQKWTAKIVSKLCNIYPVTAKAAGNLEKPFNEKWKSSSNNNDENCRRNCITNSKTATWAAATWQVVAVATSVQFSCVAGCNLLQLLERKTCPRRRSQF